jgi:hypothetical protein
MRKRQALEARIEALRKEFEAEEDEASTLISEEASQEELITEGMEAMARSRQADEVQDSNGSRKRKGKYEKVGPR